MVRKCGADLSMNEFAEVSLSSQPQVTPTLHYATILHYLFFTMSFKLRKKNRLCCRYFREITSRITVINVFTVIQPKALGSICFNLSCSMH